MLDEGELVGEIFQFPDAWWGFDAAGRSDHPGACVGYSKRGFNVTMLKGTDEKAARFRIPQVVVAPSHENGLLKHTSFAIEPRTYSASKLYVLSDVRIGRLSHEDLEAMRIELNRQFGVREEFS